MPFGIGKAVKRKVKKVKRSRAFKISRPVIGFVGNEVPAVGFAKAVGKSVKRAKRSKRK